MATTNSKKKGKEMKVVAPQYISSRMSKQDVLAMLGFVWNKKEHQKIIDGLVNDGMLENKGIYYTATIKLYYSVKLPDIIIINKTIRTILTKNEIFTKEELCELFYNNDIIVHWLKMNGYITQSSDCRFRKSDRLCEVLAEGENITTKEGR